MKDKLILGDYAYSSWSLRGWLVSDRFGLELDTQIVDFNGPGVAAQMAAYGPVRTVPALVTADGTVVWESLAVAEELASRFPGAGHWPADPALRATARSLAAEMHSGFSALRAEHPMNLRCAYRGLVPSDAVRADLDRIQAIWAHALARSGGPWLCGDYSVADAFFAPVAARIATYGLAVDAQAQAYVAAHLADPSFRRWRAMGLVHGDDLPWYARDFEQVAWPGPSPRAARAVTQGAPENAACPYSGRPEPRHLLQIDGRTFGFCNPFCRDKTMADPEAWPRFMALLDG